MRWAIFLLIFLSLSYGLFSQEIAQWRGPERDGMYTSKQLLTSWPAEGPPMTWSCSGIGKGYTTAVSDGSRIFITGMRDSSDYLTALDLKGNILWQIPVGPSWNGPFPDTRCTPTVENGVVYVISGLGTICAVHAADGKVKWSLNGFDKFGGACGDWGVCESPLIVRDMLIYTPAGNTTTMVAMDKHTGATVWKSPTLRDTSAYVSPRLLNINGKQTVVTLTATWLIGVDPDNGEIRWKFNYASFKPEKSLQVWPGAPKTNTITPLYKDGHIYITGGYNHPGVMLKVADDGRSAGIAWSDTTLDCHHGGVVLLGDYIYGSNWIDNSRGNWCCIDWKTGSKMYEHKWNTKGSVIACNGMLYIYEEKNGHVGLLKPGPSGFELAGSFRVPEGKGPCWAHPSIYDGMLYVRRGDVLLAFDIREK